MTKWLDLKNAGLSYAEKLGRVENNIIYVRELIEQLSKLDLATIKDFELQFRDLKKEFEKLVLNFDTFKADIETIIQKNKIDIQKEQKDFENKILALIEKSAIPGEIKAFGEVDKEALKKIGWKQLEIENGFTLLNSFDNGQKIGINTSGHIAKHNHKLDIFLELIYKDATKFNITSAIESPVTSPIMPSIYTIENNESGNINVVGIKQSKGTFNLFDFNSNVESIINEGTLKDKTLDEGLNQNNYAAGLYVNYFIFDPKDVYDPKTGLLKK